jgi:hypothetical protein
MQATIGATRLRVGRGQLIVATIILTLAAAVVAGLVVKAASGAETQATQPLTMATARGAEVRHQRLLEINQLPAAAALMSQQTWRFLEMNQWPAAAPTTRSLAAMRFLEENTQLPVAPRQLTTSEWQRFLCANDQRHDGSPEATPTRPAPIGFTAS